MTPLRAAGAALSILLIPGASLAEGMTAVPAVHTTAVTVDVEKTSIGPGTTDARSRMVAVPAERNLGAGAPDLGLLPGFLAVFGPISAEDGHSGE